MDTTTYKLLFLLHIVTFVVAFAPAALMPLLVPQYVKDGEASGPLQRFFQLAEKHTQRVHVPALLLSGLFGILLVLQSDEVWQFDQTWITLAFLLWIAMVAVFLGVLLPGERRLARGDAGARTRYDIGGAVITVLFLIMLYVMIWKPGL